MIPQTDHAPEQTDTEKIDRVVIRLAGDSGDGIQLSGNQLSASSAIAGNDLATLPDFPAEIRAPAGTLPGVSGYQISFSNYDIHTPGDQPDALVAFNPAALKVNLPDLKRGGLLIVNSDAFQAKNLQKAGYEKNPLEDNSLDGYRTIAIPITDLNRKALAGSGKLDETAAVLRKALALRPDYAPAHLNLGRALHELGDTRAAQRHFRAASDLDPGLSEAHSAYLFALSHDASVSPQDAFAEHLRIGDLMEAPYLAARRGHDNDRDPERDLRIGFVSGDLHDHPIANLIEQHQGGFLR